MAPDPAVVLLNPDDEVTASRSTRGLIGARRANRSIPAFGPPETLAEARAAGEV